MQYFFAFDTDTKQARMQVEAKAQAKLRLEVGDTFSNQGMLYRAFPIARNEILVRIENLQDRFDGSNDTKFIDM